MTHEELLEKVNAHLGDDAELRGYRDARRRDSDLRYLPDYHFCSPGGYLNDPCGYCFYKGVWHLFYQFIPEWMDHSSVGWGHAVSVDRVRWIDLPCAIMPDDLVEFCGSGGALVEEDRVLACYQGWCRGTETGSVSIMESTDELLVRWHRVGDGPAIFATREDGTKNEYDAFDPYMWREGEDYFLLTAGGGSVPHPPKEITKWRTLYLFSSKDLIHWEYLHEFMKDDRFSVFGDDGACPYFLPFGEDKYLILHYSHMRGGQYIVGRYDKEARLFYAEEGTGFNRHNAFYGGFHAPSACADGNGGVHAIFNINYGYSKGPVNQIMSLPYRFTRGERSSYRVCPDVDLTPYRERLGGGSRVVKANEETVLEGIFGDVIEMELTVDSVKKEKSNTLFLADNLLPSVELRVLRSPDAEEYTTVRILRNRGTVDWRRFIEDGTSWASTRSVIELDASHSTLSDKIAIHPTESGEIAISADESVKLRIFVDRSIVEVFADDHLILCMRTYPTREDSVGVSVLSKGKDARVDYEAWRIKRIRSVGNE